MNYIDALAQVGTSTWLDDLSRDRLSSGNLAELIDTKSIVGVTTNPAIFAKAMTTGEAYDAQLAELKESGADSVAAVAAMSISDVRDACDIFAEVYQATGGRDGFVSIEVDPRISEDTEATVAQATEIYEKINRDNVMIKIPATDGSLSAISEVLAAGISVNVTLIFSVEQYRKVLEAYRRGIHRAADNGHDISRIQSVASFFVSRLDTEIDRRLEAIGSPEALALRGQAGIANARRAYAAFEAEGHTGLPEGANLQRPLWASTGVKNPEYPPTLYVTELAGPNTVNTMPESTIDAVLHHGGIYGDTLSGTAKDAEETFRQLRELGIDFDDVFATLNREGVDKFVSAWNDLLSSIDSRL